MVYNGGVKASTYVDAVQAFDVSTLRVDIGFLPFDKLVEVVARI